MPQYVVLMNLTEQGVKAMKNSAAMRSGAEQAIAAKGGKLLWDGMTLGRYDLVAVVDLPNDETCLEIALAMGASGMYRSETLKAFTPDQVNAITARLP